MGFEMIDGDQRLSRRECQCLGGDEADHDASDQPRTRRRRDRVEVFKLQPGLVERLRDHSVQQLDVSTGGDFRDNSAERLMQCVLAKHDIRQDFPGPGGVPRTTEAAVSSQLVSSPRTVKGFESTRMVSIYAKGPFL